MESNIRVSVKIDKDINTQSNLIKKYPYVYLMYTCQYRNEQITNCLITVCYLLLRRNEFVWWESDAVNCLP